MRCARCGYAVPDWMWITDDHPIIVEEAPARIIRFDLPDPNTFKIVHEQVVALRMCKDVHPQPAESNQKESVNDRTLPPPGEGGPSAT